MSPSINQTSDRAAVNKANAQKSTGPRTEAGKQRSKLNALRHGLTGHTIVLPTEDYSAYQRHSQAFLDEYRPQGATETQLVQSLLDTSWQLNRAAAVETNLFSLGITEMDDRIRANHPQAEDALAMALTFREHNRAFANLGIYRQRLTRQFERTLILLRSDPGRAPRERRAPARQRRQNLENAPGRQLALRARRGWLRFFNRRNRAPHHPRRTLGTGRRPRTSRTRLLAHHANHLQKMY